MSKTWFAVVLSFLLFRVASAQLAADARVFVIGFDGLDHGRVESLMAEGRMPNFARLAAKGSHAALIPPIPAQSPVSWSCLTTGLNPGKTGIDDFLSRDFSDGSVTPELSLVSKVKDDSGFLNRRNRALVIVPIFILTLGAFLWSVRRRRWVRSAAFGLLLGLATAAWLASSKWLPDGLPQPRNNRQAKTYWEMLDSHGVDNCTLMAPCSFPAPVLGKGRVLSGLGVPDVAGSPGFWTVLRDDLPEASITETGGRLVPLKLEKAHEEDTPCEPVEIEGPWDVVRDDGSRTSAVLRPHVSRRDGVVALLGVLGGRSALEGRWSEPINLLYRTNPLVNVLGRTRFKVLSMDPVVAVYIDPVGFDPSALPPGCDISHPRSYAHDLEVAVGSYETTGWGCATNALKDGQIDERTFLEDAQRKWDEEERLAIHEISARRPGIVTAIFSATDRIQHMFFRHDRRKDVMPGSEAELFAGAIDDAYLRADSFVGRVMDEYLREGDVLLVVSDHGFAPWRRAVNLNTLLLEKGHLVLKDRRGARSIGADLGSSAALGDVDWTRTRAYALGLGKIYLNRKGREPHGIVEEGDVGPLLDRISRELRDLRDGDVAPVVGVERGAAIYDGEAIKNGRADLYVSLASGYRVSWQNCLGGTDEPVLTQNDNAWSGDHCGVDPDAVRGVLFSSRALKSERGVVRAVDVGATVMALFGKTIPEAGPKDGVSLLP